MAEEKLFLFDPRPDITAYELAYILTKASNIYTASKAGVIINTDQWETMPDIVRRHFFEKVGSYD